MAEYALHLRVPGSVQEVYDYLSDLDNLTEYLPRLTTMPSQTSSGRISVEAFSGGEERNAEARYSASDEDYRLEWSASDHDEYSGSLEVQADGDASIVHLSLKTTLPHQDAIRDGVSSTLDAIKAKFAGTSAIDS